MATAADEKLDVIWGSGHMAKLIGRSERQVNHLLAKGELPGAKKMAGRWCITRRNLFAAFEGTSEPEVRR